MKMEIEVFDFSTTSDFLEQSYDRDIDPCESELLLSCTETPVNEYVQILKDIFGVQLESLLLSTVTELENDVEECCDVYDENESEQVCIANLSEQEERTRSCQQIVFIAEKYYPNIASKCSKRYRSAMKNLRIGRKIYLCIVVKEYCELNHKNHTFEQIKEKLQDFHSNDPIRDLSIYSSVTEEIPLSEIAQLYDVSEKHVKPIYQKIRKMFQLFDDSFHVI